MSKLLVIFGATGQQGGSILNHVLADPHLSKEYTIRAITRDASKPNAKALQAKGAQVVSADASNPSSLPAALKGAHTVFGVTVTTYDAHLKATEFAQGKAIADAAVAAGASYIIFSSQLNTTNISGGKVVADFFDVKADIEAYIRSLAPKIKSAFFAPAPFMLNFHDKNKPQPMGDGTYAIVNIVTPETESPLIDILGDTGKFVGAILAEPEKYEGKMLTSATKVYTMAEIAEVLTKATGKKVMYIQLPVEKFKGFMPNAVMADNTVAMFEWMQDFGYFGKETRKSVEWSAQQAIGKLSTFEEFLEKNPLKLE